MDGEKTQSCSGILGGPKSLKADILPAPRDPAAEGQVQKHVHSPTRGPSTRPRQRALNTGGSRQRGVESCFCGHSPGSPALPHTRGACTPEGKLPTASCRTVSESSGALFTQTLAKHVPQGAACTLTFESHGNLEASHGFICSWDSREVSSGGNPDHPTQQGLSV